MNEQQVVLFFFQPTHVKQQTKTGNSILCPKSHVEMWKCEKCETLNVIFPKTLKVFLKLDKSFEN